MAVKRALTLAVMAVIAANVALAYAVVPHVNPETVREDIDPLTLLRAYAMIAEGILGEEVPLNFTLLISEIRGLHVPDWARARVGEVARLLDRVYREMREGTDLAERAEELAMMGELEEAARLAGLARAELARANASLAKLYKVYDALCHTLLKAVPPAARERFEALRREFKGLLDELAARIAGLYERCLGFEEKPPPAARTVVTIEAEPREVVVGSWIVVRGVLRSVHGPLPGRTVVVSSPVGGVAVRTGADGGYEARLRVVGYYNETMRITVAYAPSGSDAEAYLPALNHTVIRVLFVRTSLWVYVPSLLAAGSDLNVTLLIHPFGGPRNLTIEVDGEAAYRGVVAEPTAEVALRVDLPPGPHVVQVSVGPLGVYSGASARRVVSLVASPVLFVVKAERRILLYPLDSVVVVGKAVDLEGGPLRNATVEVRVGGAVRCAKVGSDGSFRVEAPIPWTVGPVRVAVRLLAPNVARDRVVVVSVVNLYLAALLSTAAAALSLSVARARRLRVPRVKRRPPPPRRPREVTKAPAPAFRLSRGGPAVRLYEAAVRLLARVQPPPKPSETLREYYRRVQSALGPVRGLWALTRMAEYELYSGRRLEERMLAPLKRLYRVVVNALKAVLR